jgi:rhodanese-related sulfurtransferase
VIWWVPFGRVPEIGAEELARTLDAVQLVDVRTRLEFARGRIRGAMSIPIQELAGYRRGKPACRPDGGPTPSELGSSLRALDRARPVVVICLSAHRSIPAVRLLRDAGFDVRQLAGGMLAWRALGLPEERG